MNWYYCRFASSVFWIGLYFTVLFLVFARMYYGVAVHADYIIAVIYMVVGTGSLIFQELERLISLRYEKIKNIRILKLTEQKIEPKQLPEGVCPECDGVGMCQWSTNESPLTCWRCSGTGKI